MKKQVTDENDDIRRVVRLTPDGQFYLSKLSEYYSNMLGVKIRNNQIVEAALRELINKTGANGHEKIK
jgi:hypothetical protein